MILEHFGLLPVISHYSYKMPTPQMFSLLLGNVSFLFAFGYFSARSSGVIQLLQRKRQEESLRSAHKLLATGNLLGSTAHDMLNYLATIKYSIRMLLDGGGINDEEREMLKSIQKQSSL